MSHHDVMAWHRDWYSGPVGGRGSDSGELRWCTGAVISSPRGWLGYIRDETLPS